MLTEYPFWRKLVEKCFAELKKQNNNVYFLNWDDAELNGDIIERLQEIKNKSKHTQIQIILYKAEPFCFVPGTNTPLQFHNLLFITQSQNCKAVIQQIYTNKQHTY